MFDEELLNCEEENLEPIARCTECGQLIYDNSDEVYIDGEQNYFCSLDCALNCYGIHQSEDYLA